MINTSQQRRQAVVSERLFRRSGVSVAAAMLLGLCLRDTALSHKTMCGELSVAFLSLL